LTDTGRTYLLNKSRGITSRKAAAKVASYWKFKKYGHAGTLDPDAEGLLIVLMGNATRLSQYLVSHRKRYRFTLVAGIETDTDDMTGKVISESTSKGITRDDLLKVIPGFTGDITQTVPAYSAVKIDGVRSYMLARSGSAIDTPSRQVWTGDWKIGGITENRIELEVSTSSGTYVRALARDIGRALGTFGTADSILRISIGEFDIAESASEPDNPDALLDMAETLRGYRRRILTQPEVIEIKHGRTIDSCNEEPETIALNDENGLLVAVAKTEGQIVKPVCVFP